MQLSNCTSPLFYFFAMAKFLYMKLSHCRLQVFGQFGQRMNGGSDFLAWTSNAPPSQPRRFAIPLQRRDSVFPLP
jgi:hypothetical protein